jgi:hypothetical protein
MKAKLRAKEQQPDPLLQEGGLKAQLKTVVGKLVKLVRRLVGSAFPPFHCHQAPI